MMRRCRRTKVAGLGRAGECGLITRPTKQSDTRARSFKGESVELDALPSAVLRSMVSGCIERHVDARALAQVRAAERDERKALSILREGLSGGREVIDA